MKMRAEIHYDYDCHPIMPVIMARWEIAAGRYFRRVIEINDNKLYQNFGGAA